MALHLKRIMRLAAVRTIRTAFNPDFALLEKGPYSGETARQAKSRMARI